MSQVESTNDALLELERSLKAELHPIKPDQSFVGRLRRRLEESPAYNQQQRLAATFLTIAAGLIVGLTIFLIGRNFIHNRHSV